MSLLTESHWRNFVFWVVIILVVVLATFLYQPAAAKTGSLLVWTKNAVYVMDIDTLNLDRVGPAETAEAILPSPGCYRQIEQSCWVLVNDRIYQVQQGSNAVQLSLPLERGMRLGEGVSWSPDGLHLAYHAVQEQAFTAELRVFNVLKNEIVLSLPDTVPAVAVAWKAACAQGLAAAGCELGYETSSPEKSTLLVGYNPATGQTREWEVSPERLFELLWSPDDLLLYSRPKRYFFNPLDHESAYEVPPGSRLAGMSPDGRYVVYYQPFTLAGCQAQEDGQCLHLGVWLAKTDSAAGEPELIYSVDLSEVDQTGGLNFIPTWAPTGNSFVFFQEGRLVHYDVEQKETLIWYKPVLGKLRSVPVFSPNDNEEAVAFVDNQGQGLSEYRLVIVNPKLQPIEHIIDTNQGFLVLAWLPY